ncbi:hypothetical protein RMHFA_05108 (plasmid) [Roseomonas mucosa]|uniref:Uncharacterized protein n=1 Tax=Roseomonas mucosa TaxID=207340 RepID=A0A379PMJ9_9PROT|nr:hypothetical protein [Roseomonas mucosa]AWV20176.1 hypothetical protein RADP37_05108 [Roseomonas mucosa]QDD97148.1 hypothetical protein ADP8_05108 [Roseomonas mucosa]UZO99294.1 hypothetical protein RMHFA_05108 [Roseomonas mucosa]SUE95492.1 Uncharacterised protein [Roseomonas mucosa]
MGTTVPPDTSVAAGFSLPLPGSPPARTTTKLTTPLANTPHTSRAKGSLIGNYDAKATSIDLGDGAIIVVHDTTVQASDFIFA